MRSFPNFPQDATCPICNTNEDTECTLVFIDDTDVDSICQAQPIHTKCLKEASFRYNEKAGIVYTWCKMESV